MKGNLVRGEQHLYLQQPGYGTSYLTGKWQIDELIAERRREQGDAFRMKAFMDDFNSRGLIPHVADPVGDDGEEESRSREDAEATGYGASAPCARISRRERRGSDSSGILRLRCRMSRRTAAASRSRARARGRPSAAAA